MSIGVLVGLLSYLGSSAAFAFTLWGSKWGNPEFGTGATITWSLMPSGTSCEIEFVGCSVTSLEDFLPTGYKDQLVLAFQTWEDVANLNFIEVVDDGSAVNAGTGSFGEIRLGGHSFDGLGRVLAHGFFPPPNGVSGAGDIHFDIADLWAIDSLDGHSGTKDIFQVASHEIGHAIGLRHEFGQPALMNAFYSEAVRGLQPDDIAGVQFLYGSPIPEPGTLWLLSTGLIGLLAFRKAWFVKGLGQPVLNWLTDYFKKGLN
ncbi:MAG: matrixin family metalloprotease [Nitrospirota bacterium]|nr:matrixin family metalloprotease [Nitrospirota bacterium]